MRIITNRPIISMENADFYSNADDAAVEKKQSIFKRAIEGQKKATGGAVDNYYTDAEIAKRQGQKTIKRTDRKTRRATNKAERIAERKENRDRRRATRKAKKDARALKKVNKYGKEVYQDKLPILTIDANGNYIKTNPDGSTTIIPKEQIKIIVNPNGTNTVYDSKDINNAQNVIQKVDTNTNQTQLIEEYTPEQTEVALDEKGNEQVYKKADVGGMSKGLKIGLIVGGSILGLALIGLIIYKLKNK